MQNSGVSITNVISYAWSTYIGSIKLMLIFSLAFIVAFLIPIFASFPTYNDAGGIFLRTASIFSNMSPLTSIVVIVALFFSLLFLSFAIVAINVVVKHSRVQRKVTKEVIQGLEKYTSKVFVILLLFSAVIIIVDMLSFGTGYSGIITSIAILIATPFVFYAPASIVIDESRVARALKASFVFFFRRFDYFLLWLSIAIIAITFFDYIFIIGTGTIYSRYVMLIFNSILILPFLVVLQSEMYMKRFKLLKR
ncbi:MAG: hypothetical protein QXW10_02775 [Candidatus Micrarchaeaceae archaeon]